MSFKLTVVADRLLTFIVFVTDLAEMAAGTVRDAFLTLRRGRRPVATVLFRQTFFTGLEALPIVAVTALVIGTVVISQIVSTAGSGSEYLTGKIMVWVVVRELAPLLTGIIVTARSGTAIAAELSQMKIGGEIEYIEGLGIPVSQYLIMPRIAGCCGAVLMLGVYFAVSAVLGGFLVASLGWHVPYESYTRGILAVLTLEELLVALVKSALFGFVIAAVCCRQGLRVGRSVTEIPQAATRGVMQSIFLLIILDGVLSGLYLLMT